MDAYYRKIRQMSGNRSILPVFAALITLFAIAAMLFARP
jgi:hypothetical protein